MESYIAFTGIHRRMRTKVRERVAAYNGRFMFLHSLIERRDTRGRGAWDGGGKNRSYKRRSYKKTALALWDWMSVTFKLFKDNPESGNQTDHSCDERSVDMMATLVDYSVLAFLFSTRQM